MSRDRHGHWNLVHHRAPPPPPLAAAPDATTDRYAEVVPPAGPPQSAHSGRPTNPPSGPVPPVATQRGDMRDTPTASRNFACNLRWLATDFMNHALR